MTRKIFRLILFGYFILLSYWMLFGFSRSSGSVYMYNLEPFSTIKLFLNFSQINIRVSVINLIGNIGMFIPFGFLIPLTWKLSYIKSIGIFIIGLTFLEVAQLITKRGSFDIDDFILNSIGFTIGYLTLKVIKPYIREEASK